MYIPKNHIIKEIIFQYNLRYEKAEEIVKNCDSPEKYLALCSKVLHHEELD